MYKDVEYDYPVSRTFTDYEEYLNGGPNYTPRYESEILTPAPPEHRLNSELQSLKTIVENINKDVYEHFKFHHNLNKASKRKKYIL